MENSNIQNLKYSEKIEEKISLPVTRLSILKRDKIKI